MEQPVNSFNKNNTRVEIHATATEASVAAAGKSAEIIRAAVRERGNARIVVGTGNSQAEVIDTLVKLPGIEWRNVDVFHLDEYVGISAEHPASFRRWLREHIADVVAPHSVNYLAGDASDLEAETLRYSRLLRSASIDVCFIGFGENGHIAFNDPHVADFDDPLTVKLVDIDERCRMQQVGEGHFQRLDEVPQRAVTLTCPTLMNSEYVVACVPDLRKAQAVRDAIEGPLSTDCPATLVFTHPKAFVFLDRDSASALQGSSRNHRTGHDCK